jgi:hypothetical protein
VGVTHYTDKHVWIKEYRNNDEVVAAVMGSCHLAVRATDTLVLPRVVASTYHPPSTPSFASWFVQVYCAPNAPVRRHHVVDGAFSVRGRDLPHGDDTLYIGISGVADITRNLTKQEMLNPPGTLMITVLPRCFLPCLRARTESFASIGDLQPLVLTVSATLLCPLTALVVLLQTPSSSRSWSCPATRRCGRGTAR